MFSQVGLDLIYIVEDDFELPILLPLPPEWWDSKYGCLGFAVLRIKARATGMPGKHSAS